MSGGLVVKISGTAIEQPDACSGLWNAIAEAAAAGPLAIVHGGGKRIDRRLRELGIESQWRDGLRVTPPEHMPVVAGVLGVEVNGLITRQLRDAGVAAIGVGLSAVCGVEPIPGLGSVGRITQEDGRVIASLQAAGLTPIVHSIGASSSGGPLNVNADEAAAGVARAISAHRVVLLTDVDGVLDAGGEPVAELEEATIDAAIASGDIAAGMIPKVRAALDSGVEAVIGSWRDAAELLSPSGSQIGPQIGPRPGTWIRRRTAALSS